MASGRPKAELRLSAEEQAQLSALAASRSLPHALVARAKLVLWAARGESNNAIAERLGWSLPTVGKWRQRFVQHRIAIHDLPEVNGMRCLLQQILTLEHAIGNCYRIRSRKAYDADGPGSGGCGKRDDGIFCWHMVHG